MKLVWTLALVSFARGVSAESARKVLAPQETSDLTSCRTQTVRPDSQIIAPFSDEAAPGLPEQAVSIWAGEVLCLGGRIDEKGVIKNLTLLHGDDATAVVSVAVTKPKGILTLEVRHSSKRWLVYRAARVMGPMNVALPTTVAPVASDLRAFETWDGATDRLVLYGFRFINPAPPLRPPAPRLFAGEDGKRPIIGITSSVGLAGIRLTELSAAFERDGFVSLPTTYVIAGIGVEGRFGPVRAGLPLEFGALSTRHRETSEAIRILLPSAGLYLGWDFLRAPGSSTFVGALLAAGSVNFALDAPSLSLFRDQLAPYGKVDGVSRSYGKLGIELGHDRYIKLFDLPTYEHGALQLGGRIGYAWQLGSDDWDVTDDDVGDDVRLRGGPAVSMTGPRFRFIVGLLVD